MRRLRLSCGKRGWANTTVARAALRPGEDAADVVTSEAEFRDVCAAGLGVGRLADVVSVLSEDEADLRRCTRRGLALLGESAAGRHQERDRRDDLLLALAPAFRLDLLELSPEGRLRAVMLMNELVRGPFGAGKQPPDLRGVARVLAAVLPLVAILAYGDEPLVTPEDLPRFGDARLSLAFGALIVLSRRGIGALPALEEALSPIEKPLDRALFIRALYSAG